MKPWGFFGAVEVALPPPRGSAVQGHPVPRAAVVVGDVQPHRRELARQGLEVGRRRPHRDLVLLAGPDVTAEIGGEAVVELHHRERHEVVGIDGVGHEPPLRVGVGRQPEDIAGTLVVEHHAVGLVAGRHHPELHVGAELVRVDQLLALVEAHVGRGLAPRQEATQGQLVARGAPVLDVPGHVVLPPGVVDAEGVAEAGSDRRGEPVQPRRLARVVGPPDDHRPRRAPRMFWACDSTHF